MEHRLQIDYFMKIIPYLVGMSIITITSANNYYHMFKTGRVNFMREASTGRTWWISVGCLQGRD